MVDNNLKPSLMRSFSFSLFTACISLPRLSAEKSGAMKNCAKRSSVDSSASTWTSK